MASPHVSIAAETLFHLGPIPVTNSLLTTWAVMLFFIIIGMALRVTLKKQPSGLQNLFEIIVEGALSGIEGVTGCAKQARQFFGVIVTIFLFVLVNNWAGLIPGVGSVGIDHSAETIAAEDAHAVVDEHAADTEIAAEEQGALTPLFRAGTADLSFTLTLALIAVLLTQFYGVQANGVWGYVKRFINFKNPIMFFVGILELISEFSKIISFSFRLFGNVFAGEVLLVVIISLVPYVAPIPFYGLEIFVGAIQALVFAILTLVFFKMATQKAH